MDNLMCCLHVIFCCFIYVAADSVNSKVIFAQYLTIKELDDSTGEVNIIHQYTQDSDTVKNIVYDDKNKDLYWTHNGKISRKQYPSDNNSAVEIVVDSGNPTGIALDLTQGHIYWTNFYYNNIRRSNLDGSNIITILTNARRPHALAIDITNGLLYFSTYSLSPKKIEKCRLDGTDRKDVISTGDDGALGITLNNGRIYWTDRNSSYGILQTSNLDGSDVQLLYSEDSRYFWSIQIHKEFTYLATFAGVSYGNIYRSPSITQFTPTSLFSGAIRGMIVIPAEIAEVASTASGEAVTTDASIPIGSTDVMSEQQTTHALYSGVPGMKIKSLYLLTIGVFLKIFIA